MLQNRLISAGLKPVLNHTEKSCISEYHRQFSMNIKKNHNIKLIFYYDIREELSKLTILSHYYSIPLITDGNILIENVKMDHNSCQIYIFKPSMDIGQFIPVG